MSIFTGQGMGVSPKPSFPLINWSNPITRGLIADLPLIEGGSTAIKEIVQKNILTLSSFSGALPAWSKDLFGQSLIFTNLDNITLSGVQGSITKNYTLFALVKRTNPGVRGNIFRSNGGADDFLWFNYQSDDSLRIFMSQAAINSTSTAPLGVDKGWHLAVATWDGNTVSIYYDGVLKVSQSGVTGTISPGGPNIGQANSTDSMIGSISCIRVWNRALNYKEIKDLYTNPWQIYNSSIAPTIVNTLSAVIANAIVGWKTLLGVGR